MKNKRVKKLVLSAVIAAIYAALTVYLAPLSYGNIQMRISEILILLAFIDPFYIWALTVGCLIANFLGPNGMADIVFGTFATFISCLAMVGTRKILGYGKASMIIASLWPSIFNGLIIGYMLHILYNLPMILSMLEVAIGEFIIVTIIGVPVWCGILKKYGEKMFIYKN